MKTAIIGAGKMGRWFTKFFLGQGDSVIVSSRNKAKLLKMKDEFGVETASNVDAVRTAERILICVSIDAFEDVVKEIHSYVKPNQVVMDICSIKEIPVKVMHKYIKTGTILGTHPVFGPGAAGIKNQNFILTPINNREKRFAEDFKAWLEERQANVFIMSPKKHDKLMSVVLGLPHFLGFVACDTLLSYPNFHETRKVAGASYRMLLTLIEAIAFEEAEFYTSLQMTLPEVDKIESLFHEKTSEWLKIVKQKDQLTLANKIKFVQRKLEKENPTYAKSYEVMHRLLNIIKN